MRRLPLIEKLVVCSMLLTATAYADGKWYDTVGIGGHVQGSYVGNLSKDTPRTNQFRTYDANNGFNLNQAQLRISKPLAEDGWGFTTKLLAGHDAGLIHSTGLGGSTDIDVQEAYVSMAVAKIAGLSFTGGKFVTYAGVEVIESPLNMMIEPGLLFFYGMPFTHTGAKLGYTVNDMLTLSGGVANGWDQVVDGNPGKTLIFQVATTPLKGLTANLSGTYGPELFQTYPAGTTPGTSNTSTVGNDNISKRTFLDLVVGYSGIDKLSLNVEGLWGQDTNMGGINDSGTSHWAGLGTWVGYGVNNFINPGVRFEVFSDQNNAGRLTAGTNQTVKDFTLVNKFITSSATFVRLEFRHDWSNQPTFTRNDGTNVRNQNTVSLDYVVTF